MEKIVRIFKRFYYNFCLRNVFFYSVIIGTNLFGNSVTNPNFKDSNLAIFLEISSTFGVIFIHNHYCLRLLLLKKRWLYYSISLIFLLLSYAAIFFYIDPLITKVNEKPNIPIFFLSMTVNLIAYSFAYLLHLFIINYIDKKEIESIKTKAEIEYLKLQLNPHFLLNALNNLYSVAVAEPNAIADKIIELSDLLRYQIETCKNDYISLLEEKKFIDQYLIYSKWKLQNIAIHQNVIGNLENFEITPMIFLPLIENAIKYSDIDHNPTINIEWIFENKKLKFSICNNYQENRLTPFSAKSGLKNLGDRLKVFHPESELKIEQTAANFKILLSLWNLNTIV